MGDKGKRRPKAKQPPPPSRGAKAQQPAAPGRTPKTSVGSPSRDESPLFCFKHIDRGADARWAFLPERIDATGLLKFMCDMSTSSWGDIDSQQAGGQRRLRRHHEQAISTLDKDAQADIQRTKLDETFGDDMYRFRLAGTVRLWGFRSGRTFHAVWWDDEHKVYPTDPG